MGPSRIIIVERVASEGSKRTSTIALFSRLTHKGYSNVSNKDIGNIIVLEILIDCRKCQERAMARIDAKISLTDKEKKHKTVGTSPSNYCIAY